MTQSSVNFIKWDIEVSPKMHEILNDILNLMGVSATTLITSEELEKVSRKMKSIVKTGQAQTIIQALNKVEKKPISAETAAYMTKTKDALIISNSGIIRYQLRNILNHKNIEAKLIETLYSGLAEYVKKLHDVVIIDYSGNTDDVFTITEEIRRIARNQSARTQIVVLVASGAKRDTLRMQHKGIDRIIEKDDNWLDEIHKEIDCLVNAHKIR